MIRYERTNEFRAPLEGEYFEHGPTAAPTKYTGGWARPVWILRRVESPAVERETTRPTTEEAPEPDYRDGEQTANVVRVLEWVKEITWQNNPHVRAALTEAIRRVRAHEKARERIDKWENLGYSGIGCYTIQQAVLALLDGEHAEGKA